MAIEIGDEEGEDNINGEEAVNNIVYDEKGVFLVGDEGKFKRTNPS